MIFFPFRTDGGHSCVGPEKSYRSCNIQVSDTPLKCPKCLVSVCLCSPSPPAGSAQDCPEGSKDFREVQCSQFDGVSFQGKLYKWMAYYGGQRSLCVFPGVW